MTVIPIVRPICWSDGQQRSDLMRLFANYAADEATGANRVDESTIDRSMNLIASYPNAWVALAFLEGTAAGFTITFERLSSFAAAPVINIHDIGVDKNFRGCGVGQALIESVFQHAQFRGACYVNLEVYRNNIPAKQLYEKLGFFTGHEDPKFGETLFMAKQIQST